VRGGFARFLLTYFQPEIAAFYHILDVVLGPVLCMNLERCVSLHFVPFIGFFPDVFDRFDKNVPTLRRATVNRVGVEKFRFGMPMVARPSFFHPSTNRRTLKIRPLGGVVRRTRD
jgi:hypothetical protein